MILSLQAFVSYMRSVYLHKDKSIFQLDKLPVDRFAASLGLPGAPKIKFLAKEAAKAKKNVSRDLVVVKEGNVPSSKSDADEMGKDSENESDEEGSGDASVSEDDGDAEKGSDDGINKASSAIPTKKKVRRLC